LPVDHIHNSNYMNECKVGMGDVCLSVSSDDREFMDYFKLYYRHSLINESPDFSVKINIQNNIAYQDIGKSLDTYRKSQWDLSEGNFSLHDNMISGSIDEGDKKCELTVEMALIASDYLPLFQDLVFKDLFYYLNKKSKSNGWRQSFMIHGCGIQQGKKGFLFLGPSGSGKSTVAKLSKKYTVLHDEVVLLTKKNRCYFIQSTPYLSDIGNLKNGSAKLKAGFFLKHGQRNHMVNLSNSKMVSRFIQQIVPSSSFHSKSPREPLHDMLSFSGDVIESIPFFELHFTPEDDSFWQVIKKVV